MGGLCDALCDGWTPRRARMHTHVVLGLERKQAIYQRFLSVFLLCLSLHEGASRPWWTLAVYLKLPFFWPAHPILCGTCSFKPRPSSGDRPRTIIPHNSGIAREGGFRSNGCYLPFWRAGVSTCRPYTCTYYGFAG